MARIAVLERMIAEHAPAMYRLFVETASHAHDCDRRTFEKAFARLEAVAFSEKVLARAPSHLAVQRVEGVGSSDVGEPQRLIEALEAVKSRPAWFNDRAREYRKDIASPAGA